MTTETARQAAGEITFADLMHCGGGRTPRALTDAEHFAQDAASPFAEFGPCHCDACERHRVAS